MFIITGLGRVLVSSAKTRLEAHTKGLRDMIVGFSFYDGMLRGVLDANMVLLDVPVYTTEDVNS